MRMMATYKNYAKKMMWGAALCAMMAGHALALDGEAFVERFGDMLKENQLVMKHQSVQVDGANIVVEGVEVAPSFTSPDSDEVIPLGTLTFNQVEEGDDGSFSIDTLVVNDIDVDAGGDGGDIRLSVSGIAAKNIYLPAAGKTVSLLEKLPYESFEIKNVALTDKGKNILILRDIFLGTVAYEQGKPLKSSFSIAHISHDTATISNKSFQEAVTEMGYAGLVEGNFEADSVWDPASGDISIDKFALNVNNVGTLSLSMNFTGLTETLYEEILKLSKQIQDKEMTSEAEEGLAMLGLVQQMSVRGLSVRFDDASVTNKLLDALAKKAETNKGTLTAGAVFQLQMMGSSVLQNPEFSAQLVSAVDSFLKNPKSIEVMATPSEPVAFSLIGGAAMFQPQSLINMLHVEVRANN